VAYNILREREQVAASVVTDNLVDALAYVWGTSGTDQTPLFARIATTIFQALYEHKLTLVEALKIPNLPIMTSGRLLLEAPGTRRPVALSKRSMPLRLRTMSSRLEAPATGSNGSCGTSPFVPSSARPRCHLISDRRFAKGASCWCPSPRHEGLPSRSPPPAHQTAGEALGDDFDPDPSPVLRS
jgi:hypothetical protein